MIRAWLQPPGAFGGALNHACPKTILPFCRGMGVFQDRETKKSMPGELMESQ
jgi:hypothetical protein